MNTPQICRYFISPTMKREDNSTDGGMKRLREKNKVVVSREKICFTTYYFPQETIIKILSDLDKRTLTIFGMVSKSVEFQVEKAWENLRIRDHLNFSWISIPDNKPDHHKCSYQLNDAIVTCYTHYGIGLLAQTNCPLRVNKIKFNLMRLKAYHEIYQKYAHVYERFSEFRCFFNDVLCCGKFEKKKDETDYITIADEMKSGGEFALKTLINTALYYQDKDFTFELLHKDYLVAIEGNATFLAFEGVKLFTGKCIEVAFDANSKICDKAVNAEELLAIKAAEKGDYNAIILLISNDDWRSAKFTLNLKLPSDIWLGAIRCQLELRDSNPWKERSDEFTLLLYVKAIESYPLGQAPDWLLEEAVAERKNIQDNESCPLGQTSNWLLALAIERVARKKKDQDNYWEIFWRDEVPESLCAIYYSILRGPG